MEQVLFEWRRRGARGGRVFLSNKTCPIFTERHLPPARRGCPWVDAESGGPYEFDRTICPEFKRKPELVRINAYEKGGGGTASTVNSERSTGPAASKR